MLEFVKLSEDDLDRVLAWRTSADVTRYMFTDVENDPVKHRDWYRSLSADPAHRYWMISYEGKKIGVISLDDIDPANKRCSWGYYIGEPSLRMLGGIIPPYLYNYVFGVLKLNKIVAQVMDGNENLMKLHAMHGYRKVGVFREHIFKNNRFYDVHTFELAAASWQALHDKYGRYTAEFES
jgi:UDP-4-amino-4,6-dideoxy-N-acetyl-beta-L-altrosamine N-acetyltransferase